MVATVARLAELAALEAALTSADAGAGRLVLLEGEAGSGKSTMVRMFAERRSRPRRTGQLLRASLHPAGRWAAPRPGPRLGGGVMARFMVERTFPEGLRIPVDAEGADTCLGVVGRTAEVGVTWVHSYVNEDRTKTFCVYDGPDADSIRRAAERNGLPVDGITRVSVLGPYFYR